MGGMGEEEGKEAEDATSNRSGNGSSPTVGKAQPPLRLSSTNTVLSLSTPNHHPTHLLQNLYTSLSSLHRLRKGKHEAFEVESSSSLSPLTLSVSSFPLPLSLLPPFFPLLPSSRLACICSLLPLLFYRWATLTLMSSLHPLLLL